MNDIHPTAIIDPAAQLGFGNKIGPYCVIGPSVSIGHGNIFTSHVSIGQAAQHRTHGHLGTVRIGNNNTFREFVTVNTGTVRETEVGNNCYIMACAHIPHDAIIEDGVTMANCALLAGHTHVMRGATLSLGCIVHQYQVIGSYSILGMGAVVTKDCKILPGGKYVGSPARYTGRNIIGLQRAGIHDDFMGKEQTRFYSLVCS